MQQYKFNILIYFIIVMFSMESAIGQELDDKVFTQGLEVSDSIYLTDSISLNIASDNDLDLPEHIRVLLSKANDSTKVEIYLQLAGKYLDESLAKSMHFANLAYDISSNNSWTKYMAESENSLGNVYYYLGDFITAQSYYFKSREKSLSLNDFIGVAGANNNLSLIYFDLKNYKRAINLNIESLKIYKKEHHIEGMASSYNNLTLIYQQLDDLQNVLDYSDSALIFFNETNDTSGLAVIYNNLGDYYTKRNELIKANQYLLKSLGLYQSIHDLPGMATVKINLAILLLRKNKTEESLPFLKNSLEISLQLGIKELISEVYKNYSQYYKQKGDYKNALDQYKTYTLYMDSIYAENTMNQINEKRVAFESENQHKRIQILKKGQESNQLRIQKQKSIGIFLIVLVGIVFSVILLSNIIIQVKSETSRLIKEKNIELFYSNKALDESRNELTRINQAKNRFLSIIAHDLISPFSAFITLSKILAENIDSLNKKEIKNYSELIFNSASNIFNLVENLLQWSRAQSGKLNYAPEFLTLSNIFNNVIQIYTPVADKKNIRIISNLNQKLKVFADPDVLSTILRNLLSNAIKFTPEKGLITLTAKVSGGMIEVYVSDTGVGMNPEDINKLFLLENNFSKSGTNGEQGNGLGLILCKEFVEIIGGTIGVQSSKNAGSTFWFNIPTIPLQLNTNKT